MKKPLEQDDLSHLSLEKETAENASYTGIDFMNYLLR